MALSPPIPYNEPVILTAYSNLDGHDDLAENRTHFYVLSEKKGQSFLTEENVKLLKVFAQKPFPSYATDREVLKMPLKPLKMPSTTEDEDESTRTRKRKRYEQRLANYQDRAFDTLVAQILLVSTKIPLREAFQYRNVVHLIEHGVSMEG